jgi:hypothetical protein
VLNPTIEGYVKVTFSKCSISYPYVAYTMNYEEFLKEDFEIQDQMREELSGDVVLKVKRGNGLYIMVKSSAEERTIMTVKGVFSASKI